MLRAARLSRSATTYVRAGHLTSLQHTPSAAQALHGAPMHCARRHATRRGLAKNGGETRSLNSR
ncbi:hypothetical protein XAP3CFBP6996_013830 [Xanthomonas citri pv. fuscans CFBP 6996]|uniref:Uncharacterized protein n=2 Tax=Xanthomonas citri TaxID=346 RepID=A0AB33CCK5_XANCI|nr:hypothetical protein XcvCFBP7111P_06065 [Xanthomonas citri pv. vignicola]PTY30111.1 hypothetical protein XAP3CFBP6996_013830 [Xanthomonas citri pv. fuscans CFBP 6996]QWN04770.1 hypothetical protein DGN16_18140 [Xanthomonas citri pv. fuscans]QWN17515.1 hypothetical protein DGN02_18260 [Xanthomonas citri]RTE56744.1 hypothetical protein EI541_16490 [Xanthomonas axonopodis pv. eucalyptorum]